MKTFKITVPVAVALCLSSGLAGAEPGTAVVRVYSLDVAQRIQNLELIDVTAEKPAEAVPEAQRVQLSADVLDILAEVDALEAGEPE